VTYELIVPDIIVNSVNKSFINRVEAPALSDYDISMNIDNTKAADYLTNQSLFAYTHSGSIKATTRINFVDYLETNDFKITIYKCQPYCKAAKCSHYDWKLDSGFCTECIDANYESINGVCKPICGDGNHVAGEACDDGWNSDADGTDTVPGCSFCKIQTGYTCLSPAATPTISTCSVKCGDGIILGTE